LKNFKCGVGEGWRKVILTDHTKNGNLLHRVKEERKILHIVTKK
jgi:hypothetical protein